MSNKNHYYENNSTKEPLMDEEAVIITEEDSEIENLVEESEEVDEPVNKVVEEPADETKDYRESLVGYVTGCKKLNIRKESYIKSDVVCVVSEKDILLIDDNKSTNEWYKVYTETGFEGYCMKKYVVISD